MRPYRNLVWMGILHIPLMYLIMFAMVDTWGDLSEFKHLIHGRDDGRTNGCHHAFHDERDVSR